MSDTTTANMHSKLKELTKKKALPTDRLYKIKGRIPDSRKRKKKSRGGLNMPWNFFHDAREKPRLENKWPEILKDELRSAKE